MPAFDMFSTSQLGGLLEEKLVEHIRNGNFHRPQFVAQNIQSSRFMEKAAQSKEKLLVVFDQIFLPHHGPHTAIGK